MTEDKTTIAVDFDGVINPYTKGWRGAGVYETPSAECVTALGELHEEGVRIIIHTAREKSEHPLVAKFLVINEVMFDEIWAGESKRAKPKADVYIDDRALNFSGSWKDVADIVRRLKSSRDSGGLRRPLPNAEPARISLDAFRHDEAFGLLVAEMLLKEKDGTKRYGPKGWNSLGAKGIFVDINRKYCRMRHVVWDGDDSITSERFEDTCFDMAVYSLFMIMSRRLSHQEPLEHPRADCPDQKRQTPRQDI